MNLRVTSETDREISLAWDAVADASGFMYAIDGDEHLVDGRRHFSMDSSRTSVTLAKPSDGKPHTYIVETLGVVGRASVVSPSPVTPPQDAVWWAGPKPPDTSPPSLAATRADVATPTDLRAVVRQGGTLRPGDVVRVRPMDVSGNIDFGVVAAGASVFFDAGVRFLGSPGTSLPAVGVHCSGVSFYGGDVTNPDGGSGTSGGDGVKAYNGSADPGHVDFRWWGLTVHDVAGLGISSQSSRVGGIHADVEAEVSNWGMRYLTLDPHTDKGTGLHGAYIGGGSVPTSGRWIIHAHDGKVGAGIECGSNLQDAELWLSFKNLTWSKDRLAGHGFQPWGGNNRNVVVKSLLVDNGNQAIFDESLSSGPITVAFCRYRNMRGNPPYQTNSHVAISDIGAA